MDPGGGAAILSPAQYEAACTEVDRALDRCEPLRIGAASELGISGPALASIHSERVIKYMGRYHTRAAAAAAALRYAAEAGTSLVAEAARARVPPTCAARVALEQCAGLDRKAANLAIRDPGRVADAGLRRLVEECVTVDAFASPRVQAARKRIGEAFERALEAMLRHLGVPFATEGDMREEGRARTPDIVLRVPVGVRDRAGRVRVVWWIDSKAYFGPPLAGNTARQLDAYVSRYGPGLVVHWFGFVEGSGGGGGGGGGPWKEDVLVSDRLPLPLLHVEP